VAFKRSEPALGYMNAPIGGVIVNPGNTVLKDLSAGRLGMIPFLIKEKCTNCGECEMTCPDFCFTWQMGKDKAGKEKPILQGINYQYCKGCMKCIRICKFKALVEDSESKYEIKGLDIRPVKTA